MSSFFLPYANSRFHGIITGNGEELLICLHGFGENAYSFERLTSSLGQLYTLVAIDLPLHGKTEWKENRHFEKDDLVAVIRLILEQQQQTRFSLMGFSMGGRLSLCAIGQLAPQMNRIILAAPDGLKNNPWHLFVTRTRFGHWLFKQVTYHPAGFFWLLHLWRGMRLISAGLYKFVNNSMNNAEKRERVFLVWTCLRNMMPDRPLCRRLLAQYKIPGLLIFGRYDRVIPPALGVRFMDGSFPCEMLVMEKGHQLISEELGETILDKL